MKLSQSLKQNWKVLAIFASVIGLVSYFSVAGATTSLEVNGAHVGGNDEPFVSHGTTYVPLTPIVEKMGGKVSNYSGKEIAVERNGRRVIVLNEWSMSIVNGRIVPLETKTVNKTTVPVDVRAVEKNGIIFVPVAFVSAKNGLDYPVKTVSHVGLKTIYVGTIPSSKPASTSQTTSTHSGAGSTASSKTGSSQTTPAQTTPTQPTTSQGQTYPDGWTAPVLTQSWSPTLSTNYDAGAFALFHNELGFDSNGNYSIPGQGNAIMIYDSRQAGHGAEVRLAFSMWGPDTYNPNWEPGVPDAYRIPVIAKQLFDFYFGSDAQTVWNYFNSNNIPPQFTANGRTCYASFSQATGQVILDIGYQK